MRRFARAPGVPFRFLKDDVILAPPGETEFESLSGTGVAVWRLLDEARSLAELVEILSDMYAAPPGLVEGDVVALLEQLQRSGSVKVVDDDA